jgi:hypothetical protein
VKDYDQEAQELRAHMRHVIVIVTLLIAVITLIVCALITCGKIEAPL